MFYVIGIIAVIWASIKVLISVLKYILKERREYLQYKRVDEILRNNIKVLNKDAE